MQRGMSIGEMDQHLSRDLPRRRRSQRREGRDKRAHALCAIELEVEGVLERHEQQYGGRHLMGTDIRSFLW